MKRDITIVDWGEGVQGRLPNTSLPNYLYFHAFIGKKLGE